MSAILSGLGCSEDKLSSRKTLSEVVVAVARKREGESLGDECAEALTTAALAVYSKGIVL